MDGAALDQLVREARDGDNAAFDQIVRLCGPELHLFVSCRVAGAELAEEIVQRSFVVAWQRLNRYQERGLLIAWLKGIARNLLLAQLRESRRLRTMDGEALEHFVCEQVELEPAAEPASPILPRLAECLDKLPPRSRALLERHHSQQVPLKTLAQQYKQKVATLTSLLHRLRRHVRLCVEGGS